jgi:hypothetical protein
LNEESRNPHALAFFLASCLDPALRVIIKKYLRGIIMAKAKVKKAAKPTAKQKAKAKARKAAKPTAKPKAKAKAEKAAKPTAKPKAERKSLKPKTARTEDRMPVLRTIIDFTLGYPLTGEKTIVTDVADPASSPSIGSADQKNFLYLLAETLTKSLGASDIQLNVSDDGNKLLPTAPYNTYQWPQIIKANGDYKCINLPPSQASGSTPPIPDVLKTGNQPVLLITVFRDDDELVISATNSLGGGSDPFSAGKNSPVEVFQEVFNKILAHFAYEVTNQQPGPAIKLTIDPNDQKTIIPSDPA